MQFRVRSIYLGDNAVNDCVMEASDEATLRAQLVGEGQTILSLYSLVSSNSSSGWLSFFKPQKLESFPVFCRELRTLTQAGMSVVEAVDTLAAREKIAKHVDTLPQALLAQLQQGKALSTSLAGLSNAPAVLVAAVRAGERTSNLSEALNDYLRFDTLVEQLRRKVISASIYPALVSSLGFAISVFLLVIVMPNFARMYQNLRGGTSGTTAIIITISSFVNKYQFEVVIGLLVVIVFSLWWIASGGAREPVKNSV
jgi:general secretion pathway protein F